ncbi:hypothetical protein NECAME_14950 [Necator americanus]|uniref:Uncharacterized protein n=1 Tax=Necator americanus TaxID=51031 RepID=W2SKE0_NECAM|nr:hypothetical protein NECAME_14950 [Necator americanus]ETN70139.1 hypothetical protein NECAME_14950 [Necator americanus]
MARFPSLFLLFFFFLTSYGVSRPRRGLAPSLVLDRLYSLRESVEKLQQMNERVRCRIKELRGTRWKRFVGPAQRLNDLIAPLSLTYPVVQPDC